MNAANLKKLKNYKDEAAPAGMVVLGLLAGTLINKGVDKLLEKNPTLPGFVQYLKPVVVAGSGIALAVLSDRGGKMKYLGYGIAGAGALGGLKLIPGLGDFLSGVGDFSGLPTTYYTERMSGLSGHELGSFGYAVSNAETQAAERFNPDLPELDGVGNTETVESLLTVGRIEEGDLQEIL